MKIRSTLIPYVLSTLSYLFGAFWLLGCTPTPPRFGNFGGPAAEIPIPSKPPSNPSGFSFRATDWFPVQARFHPDGSRMVVNFCHVDAPYFCRMAYYNITRKDWHLVPQQQEGVSYYRPSFSNDGKTLVFSQDVCGTTHQECDGYGDHTLMPIEGGPTTLLPMHRTRRAHFTADDQRITYWRVKGSGRLASGRAVGSVGVYEFNLASGKESHLSEPMETGRGAFYFIADLTAPRYTVDGRSLFFCALNGDTTPYQQDKTTWHVLPHPIPGLGANCLMLDVEKKSYSLVSTDRMGVKMEKDLGMPYVHHQQLGLLTGPLLKLKNVSTGQIQKVLLNTGHINRADADLNPQGSTAVAVTGTTLFRNGQHNAVGAYSIRPRAGGQDAPALALIDIPTQLVVPLEWPDLTRLVAAQ